VIKTFGCHQVVGDSRHLYRYVWVHRTNKRVGNIPRLSTTFSSAHLMDTLLSREATGEELWMA